MVKPSLHSYCQCVIVIYMKICTYNVNSIKARLELVLAWLNKRNNDIDILCFQELKGVSESFPYDVFKDYDYNNIEVFGQKTYNGVSICSKHPIESVTFGIGEKEFDQQKRVISVKIDGITIINVYAPHGDIRGLPKYEYKFWWYNRFIEYIKAILNDTYKVVVLGDLNITKDDLDVYDERALRDTIGTMPEERDELNKLFDLGLIDSYRQLYPDKIQYTWWSYMGGAVWKDLGMRIDYILLTPKLVKTLKNVEVDIWARKKKTPKPSDHAPVIATFL